MAAARARRWPTRPPRAPRSTRLPPRAAPPRRRCAPSSLLAAAQAGRIYDRGKDAIRYSRLQADATKRRLGRLRG
jgi:hypothetical protein